MRKQLLGIILLVLFFVLPKFPLAKPLPQSIPKHLSIMTFNIENGGTQINFNKVVEAIKKSGADVVGIQESWGNTIQLARELGWKYHNVSQHIISRFPLYETTESRGFYTFIELSPGRFVALANVHLPDKNYGPELISNGKSPQEVEDSEQRIRVPKVLPIIEKLIVLAHRGVPVFLVGDFNSGSYLDWSQATVGKLANHNVVVQWPVTKRLKQLGFVDTYRTIHPDILNHPGYTWPAQRPFVPDNYNPSVTDMPERIDFIFFNGHVKVLGSSVVGEPNSKESDLAINPWPSDHRAVITKMEVSPAPIPIKNYVSTSIVPPKNPILTVSKKSLMHGEAFVLRWRNAPGNRYDYISIEPNKDQKSKSAEGICLYTKATVNGHIKFNPNNAKARVDCFRKKRRWPATPGVYNIKLVQDDSYKVLASTQIRIF